MVWYAIARSIKPKILVETGVDQGMGAVVLCAALARRYYGTDINSDAGYSCKCLTPIMGRFCKGSLGALN